MARVIDLKCPKCAAPLPIGPDATLVTCRYCGGTSAVERPGKPTLPPLPGQTVVHVPATDPAGPRAMTGVFVTLAAVGVAVTMSATTRSPGPIAVSDAVPGIDYRFDDRPMLADINGDGTLDIIGRVEKSETSWIAAFDGTSGAELWRSGLLGATAGDGQALRGIALDRFVAVDALGAVQTFDLKTGEPAWSASLGERGRSLCAGPDTLVITTTDGARHGFDPRSGAATEATKPADCAVVYSTEWNLAPAYRLIHGSDFEEYQLPSDSPVGDISVRQALIPAGPGPRFLLGHKASGTAVPAVAAVGDQQKLLWQTLVPGVDPLTTRNIFPLEAGFGEGVLVMPYELENRQGLRMAALTADTGARVWDVAITDSPFSRGIVVAGDKVFHAIGRVMEVRALKTGELLFKVGR